MYVQYISVQMRRIARKGMIAKPYIHVIASLLHHEDSSLRKAAAGALGELGEVAADHADALMQCALEDADLRVRRVAAMALGGLGEAASQQVRTLADVVVNSPKPDERGHAAKALSFVGDIAAEYATELSGALNDESPVVRASIAVVLASLAACKAFSPSDSWAAEKEQIKVSFHEFDKSQDGKLDLNELDTFLRRGRPDISTNEVRALFKEVDCDSDGFITFDEFVDFVFSHDAGNLSV